MMSCRGCRVKAAPARDAETGRYGPAGPLRVSSSETPCGDVTMSREQWRREHQCGDEDIEKRLLSPHPPRSYLSLADMRS